MSDAVLVTGAFGLVGSATVKQLVSAGRRVVATDLETEATRKAAAELPSGVQVRWADLTDPAAVETLLAEVSPAAIIHLAAVIPPLCYAKPQLAYKVNVGATANLVKAAEAQAKPPRLVQASSIAVYGPRNPYTNPDVLTAQTPVNPQDNYGMHKVEAEGIVRASNLEWVILRLGGVLTTEPNLGMDPNLIFFEGVLPTDGRLQTVDVRDVAFAFAAATTADALGQTLLIGGDDTHRLRQGDIGSATSAAMGLVGALPPGRKGDPNDDGGWFATDWMDTATAQALLSHQHYSWPEMLAETANKVGWKRYVFRVVAPIAREYLKRQSPYYGQPPGYGNPWEAVRRKWGAPENDGKVS
ncbi:NAD-dependent epimerase/dehydratase family protein [Mycolicibacterium sp. Dal123E01]|uniref:NAD-dependent epimerase/dehydratase family protein n=1 Tax=Mycolicibacterium sp. Dal123E01 TaxID=3457578 RepID=UPI00403EBBF4